MADELERDAIDEPERHWSEVELRIAVPGFFQSYNLSYKCFADKDQLALPPDLAIAAHPAQVDPGRIAGILQPRRIAPQRGRVVLRRRSLAQRLMRPLLVELGAELIEAPLLRRRTGGGRVGALGLERAMHPFMPSVLLRLARLDPLGHNPELDPPYRQPAQAAGAHRGERRAVVRAHRAGQAVLPEHPLQRGGSGRSPAAPAVGRRAGSG